MKIAFIIYEGMTALDFIGVYDPIARLKTMQFLPELEWEICSLTPHVSDDRGLGFIPTKVSESLSGYDLIIVPGGVVANVQKLIDSTQFMEWLKTSQSCRFKVSVCTGSLLLGEAGFFRGKKATTHPNHFHELEKFCDQVINQRIVDEGDVITAGGVTSSIDLGLYLCKKFAGSEVKEKVRRQIDYPHIL